MRSNSKEELQGHLGVLVQTHVQTMNSSTTNVPPDRASSLLKSSPAEARAFDVELSRADAGNSKLAPDVVVSSAAKPGDGEVKVCKAGGWKTTPFIFASEFCEKLAAGGLHANMISFLTEVMHAKTVDAANTVTNFNGTSSLTPLIGAFLADSYLGRYVTIVIFSSIHLLGTTMLATTSLFPSLTPQRCSYNQSTAPVSVVCQHPASAGQMSYVYAALMVMALGSGGIRPCVSPFGADQFDIASARHEKQMAGFFNWFYFVLSLAFLLAVTVVVYVQENVGWGWGFGIPAIAMSLGIAFFLSGTAFYRRMKPNGSPMTRLSRVLVAAIRKRSLPLPHSADLLYHDSPDQDEDEFGSGRMRLQHTKQLRFLDRAAILQPGCGVHAASPWRLCSVSHVEELKCIVRMMPIWLATITMHTSTSQQGTFTVQQARVMDRRFSHGSSFQIPPGSFGAFSLLVMLAFIPLYDRFLLPAVRTARSGRGLTPLERIGAGLVVGILSMVVAGIVEDRRRHQQSQDARMSAFWLVPQYGILGLADSLTIIGQLEFSYTQSPESLRSTSTALHWTTIAAGSYLSSVLVSVVNASTDWLNEDLNKGRLHYFYWMLAALNVANMVFYLACARWYKYVNMVPAHNVDEEVN